MFEEFLIMDSKGVKSKYVQMVFVYFRLPRESCLKINIFVFSEGKVVRVVKYHVMKAYGVWR